MGEITVPLWIAFISGVAAFFSPCIIPVLPGFFAFLGNTSAHTKSTRWHIFGATLLFACGFALIFILFGVGVHILGTPLTANRTLFEKIGGVLLIIFGILLTDLISFPPLFRSEGAVRIVRQTGQGLKNFLLGIIFGFAWIPCIGPILGTILYLATGEKTAFQGGFLLFVFSLGLAFPLLIFALFVPELTKFLRKISVFAHYSRLIFAVIFIALGLLLFFGQLSTISGMLISKFGSGLTF